MRILEAWNKRHAAALLTIGAFASSALADGKLTYPITKKGDTVEDLHGQKVADPYRWLEELDSPDTKAWIESENEVTFGYLRGIPQREMIRKRLTELWDYDKFGMPQKQGDNYFFSKQSGLENQPSLWVSTSLKGEPRLLLNPNELSTDGTVALSGWFPSDNGNLLAYSLSSAGSDWQELKVRDVATGNDLDDHILWAKFTGASWTNDNQGFFYSRYDEPKGDKLAEVNYFQKLYYHRIGTPQSSDRLVYERPDQKEWGFGGFVSDDGQYLLISVSQGTERKNRFFYQDLKANDGKTVELLNDFDAMYNFAGNDGPVFYFVTNLDAARSCLIAIDTTKPQRDQWKTIIPESKDSLQGVNYMDGQFIATYLQDAHTLVRIFDTAGKHLRDVELPGIGSAGGFGGKQHDKETFYSFSSFNYPPKIFRYDLTTGKAEVFREPKVAIDPSAYEVKQVFYNSKDGTRIPMFICHKKGVQLNGANPTYLYGYGGFNIPITPNFSISNVVWMELGGVYAQACLRGGGEYGREWHDGGRLKNKQNVFDDFISAGEWLIANKYTNPKRLAIGGGSNGGLLVGATITQRPELFAAALPAVGVMDMLRFHKFTIGWAWTSDYGSPDDAEMFNVLKAYSPLHNIKPGTKYPATMITTGDHDDRVVPSHSFKFAAAIQAAQSGDAPVLIRVETRAGHGAGKPTAKIIDEQADRWAFLVKNLGMDVGVDTK